MKKTTLVAGFAMFLIGLSTLAFASPVVGVGTATTVAGNANVFAPVSLTGASFDGSGTTPTEYTGITGGAQYDVTNVSGNVNCSNVGGFCGSGNGADGGTGAASGTNISAPGNGISGISFSGDVMFLVGVFIIVPRCRPPEPDRPA